MYVFERVCTPEMRVEVGRGGEGPLLDGGLILRGPHCPERAHAGLLLKQRNLGWLVSYTGPFPAVVRFQGWSELPDGTDVGALAPGERVILARVLTHCPWLSPGACEWASCGFVFLEIRSRLRFPKESTELSLELKVAARLEVLH